MQCTPPEVSRIIRDCTVLETNLVLSNKVSYGLPYYRARLTCHGKNKRDFNKTALSALPVFPLHFFNPFRRD